MTIARLPMKTGYLQSHFLKAALVFFTIAYVVHTPSALARPSNTIPTTLPENRDPCALFTEDATYISQSLIMQLEHRRVDLQVPVEFFEDPWDRKNGFTDTEQLFRVEIGSFNPISRAETGKRNRNDIWNWMDFVVSDVLPLDQIAKLSIETWSGVGDRNLDRALTSYRRIKAPFGLVEMKADGKQPTKMFRTNTYLSEDPLTGIKAVIECNATDSVAFPSCQQFFRAVGMDVHLNYLRTELPNWQEFQADITHFLVCATASKT